MARYYRLHAGIYDATRWSFLFGRREILRRLPADLQPARILEIGCGTGRNLAVLARRFPAASLVGVDVAEPMLNIARRRLGACGDRLELRCEPYSGQAGGGAGFDLILASYCLSMINPGWETVITGATGELAPAGILAVADFHDTPFAWFRRWMGCNHVRMDGHLLTMLNQQLPGAGHEVIRAYAGVWNYFLYVGRQAPRAGKAD